MIFIFFEAFLTFPWPRITFLSSLNKNTDNLKDNSNKALKDVMPIIVSQDNVIHVRL